MSKVTLNLQVHTDDGWELAPVDVVHKDDGAVDIAVRVESLRDRVQLSLSPVDACLFLAAMRGEMTEPEKS